MQNGRDYNKHLFCLAIENARIEAASSELPVPHSAHLGVVKVLKGLYQGEYVNLNYCSMYEMFVIGLDPQNYPCCSTPCMYYGKEAIDDMLKDIQADNRVINRINVVMEQRR